MPFIVPPPTRRSLILGAGAAFIASTSPARGASSANPFTLGIASGDPAPDGFVLWTRLALDPLSPDGRGGMGARPVAVRWEISEDDTMRRLVATGETQADPRLAHAVHVEATGLAPGRLYFYRFTAMGAQSAIGKARTATASDQALAALRFGFVSCSHYEEGYFSAYRHLAAEAPDVVFYLGDYIYEYTVKDAAKTVRRHDSMDEIADLPGYRNRYALYRTDPDLQALHAAAPAIVTWDDHEVENDYNNLWSEDPATTRSDFKKRRAAAYQAFYEHMPLRRTSLPRGASLKLHRRLRFGDLLDVSVLDGRQYRSDKQPCPTAKSRRGHVADLACLNALDPRRSMLGAAQERWLYDSFRETKRARWTLVAQDLLVARFLQKNKEGVLGHYTDGWDAFADNRARMLNAIAATRAPNVVFISGDIHSFWANDLKADFRDDNGQAIATEFVGGSVSANPPPYELFMETMHMNPHVRFFDSRQHGYVRVDLAPDRMETRFQIISNRRDPNATLSTLKTFVVENGKAGVAPG